MRMLFIKSTLYLFLIIIVLEVLVRVFHLYTEVPIRYIDEFGVEKSLPNQTGFAVTGNRRQNYSEYHINNFGFNSSREFTPSKEKIEIAVIGDSFIEGMHQDYYDSTGAKLEKKLKNQVEVYEFGYAGYNFSDQLHLINTYKEKFRLIDYVIIYLKFENDLEKSSFKPNTDRIALLSSPLFKIRDNFKLLSYSTKVGVLDPIKNLAITLTSKKNSDKLLNISKNRELDIDLILLENFKKLIETYGFNKKKYYLLLDSRATSSTLIKYCNSNGYEIIDFAKAFELSNTPPTLIYDKHWNNHGRELVSEVIADRLKKRIQ